MTAPEEAMDYLDVRNRWPNEATDFTPWVAETRRPPTGALTGSFAQCWRSGATK